MYDAPMIGLHSMRTRSFSPLTSSRRAYDTCSILAQEWNYAFALMLVAAAAWAAEPVDPFAAAAFTLEAANVQRIQNDMVSDGCRR